MLQDNDIVAINSSTAVFHEKNTVANLKIKKFNGVINQEQPHNFGDQEH